MRKVNFLLWFIVLSNCSAFAEPLSFRREPGSKFLSVRKVEAVQGGVYVYATFEMGPANPIEYVNGPPQWIPAVTGEDSDIGPGGNPTYKMRGPFSADGVRKISSAILWNTLVSTYLTNMAPNRFPERFVR